MYGSPSMVKPGALCLIIFAVMAGIMGIIDAHWFAYPFERDFPVHAADALSFVQNSGLRQWMTLGCLLPLLLIPGSIGIYFFLRHESNGMILTAHYFALVAMLAWMVSEMLWPAFNWYIAQYQYNQPVPAMVLLVISGLTDLIHIYVGEYLKLSALGVWFFLVSLAAYRREKLPRWLCLVGVFFALAMWVAIFFRIFSVDPSSIEHSLNYVPLANLWFFMVGVVMWFQGEK